MKTLLFILALGFLLSGSSGQARTIHVFVALCDNEHQGIVPVPSLIGNGKDARNNLYWGAAYGVKNYFRNKTTEWALIKSLKTDNPDVLERLIFKHKSRDVYLLADAYDGERIKACTEQFLRCANGQSPLTVTVDSAELSFGGHSDLIAYIGHNGLMDFDVNLTYKPDASRVSDVIILACYSKSYFSPEIRKAKANPVLWTTHLMAPEAYTLKAAIDGWMLGETGAQVRERAAQAYNAYQKCGIKGARNLFSTGH
jgi:hypothetical protein